mgnify:CR=1 FL=1
MPTPFRKERSAWKAVCDTLSREDLLQVAGVELTENFDASGPNLGFHLHPEKHFLVWMKGLDPACRRLTKQFDRHAAYGALIARIVAVDPLPGLEDQRRKMIARGLLGFECAPRVLQQLLRAQALRHRLSEAAHQIFDGRPRLRTVWRRRDERDAHHVACNHRVYVDVLRAEVVKEIGLSRVVRDRDQYA